MATLVDLHMFCVLFLLWCWIHLRFIFALVLDPLGVFDRVANFLMDPGIRHGTVG